MNSEYVLSLAHSQAILETVGGKGASLARLSSAGLPVPDGFHITTSAYQRFVAENHLQPGISTALNPVDILQATSLELASKTIEQLFLQASIPPDIIHSITNAYNELSEQDAVVAVRSSATAEDLPDLSFAGQQETFLNIKGLAPLLDAVKQCWASLWTARAIAYRTRNNIDHTTVSLAVVVQELVPAEASGILFTANPMNGKIDEMVINAAWGLGEAIVGGLVTPDTLTMNKSTGDVLSRQIADKEIMTVRVNGGTEEQAVPDELRHVPVLNEPIAAELVNLGAEIESLFNTPSDIEWVWANNQLYILQARPITVLPELEILPPTEWEMPDPKGKYMRTSIVDIMPDPLSPLFATMGLAAINGALLRWVEGMINASGALPDETIVTINGFAYYSTSFTKKQWWLLITRLLPAFPRMLRTGVTIWREVAHPNYSNTVKHWKAKPLHELTKIELLQGIHEILDVSGDHVLSLMASTMGPSAGSEGLFTQVYERLIKRPEDPPASTFLMGFDSIPIRSEKALYDLAQWCREYPSLAAILTNTSAEELVSQYHEEQAPVGFDEALWHEWKKRFSDYLENFGYSIYTLDFGHPLPMDDPQPMLEALKMFIAGQAKNPHERQQQTAQRRDEAVTSVLERIGGLRRWLFLKALNWAQSLAPLREDGISEIGLGYPLLRQMLRELGQRFARANIIADANDIFWLTQSEVEQIVTTLNDNKLPDALIETVRIRNVEWHSRKQVIPPPMIPPSKSYMGFSVETFMPSFEDGETDEIIKGMGTSPGRVTATARVLLDSADFGKMQPGDILVAPITTPAWTPLFTMASGVVTDIGGPLSHGSIVAREYGIPAVMGTGTATRRIRSGQTVTIDGSEGLILLSPNDAAPTPADEGEAITEVIPVSEL